MDTLQEKSPADLSRISLSEDWEVKWWARTLGISAVGLIEAIEKVGNKAEKVKQYLTKAQKTKQSLKKEEGLTIKILSAAIAGTTAMTLFSYIVSAYQEDNFKEPKLLGKLIHRTTPGVNENEGQVAGWLTHYGVGVAFAVLYAQLWERTKIKPTYKSGFILGALSGLAAVLTWKAGFKLHPIPPYIDYKKYYKQLFFAHLIFGLGAAKGYNLPGIISGE